LFAAEETIIAPIWSLLLVLGITAVLVFFDRRRIMLSEEVFSALDYVFSLGWFYRLMEQVFADIRKAVAFINTILEGQGGILWAILLLTLLLSLVAQIGANPGG
jgi:hypothetical protein